MRHHHRPSRRSRRPSRPPAWRRPRRRLRADRGTGGDAGGGTASADQKTVTLVTHDSWAVPKSLVKEFEQESGYDAGGAAQRRRRRAHQQARAHQGPARSATPSTASTTPSPAAPSTRACSRRTPRRTPPRRRPTTRPRATRPPTLTPVDWGDVCVNVDDAWFADHDLAPPRTLDDLTDPAYQDLFVTPGAASSSPGLAFLLATIAKYGDDGWQDYWSDARWPTARASPAAGPTPTRSTSPAGRGDGRPPDRAVLQLLAAVHDPEGRRPADHERGARHLLPPGGVRRRAGRRGQPGRGARRWWTSWSPGTSRRRCRTTCTSTRSTTGAALPTALGEVGDAGPVAVPARPRPRSTRTATTGCGPGPTSPAADRRRMTDEHEHAAAHPFPGDRRARGRGRRAAAAARRRGLLRRPGRGHARARLLPRRAPRPRPASPTPCCVRGWRASCGSRVWSSAVATLLTVVLGRADRASRCTGCASRARPCCAASSPCRSCCRPSSSASPSAPCSSARGPARLPRLGRDAGGDRRGAGVLQPRRWWSAPWAPGGRGSTRRREEAAAALGASPAPGAAHGHPAGAAARRSSRRPASCSSSAPRPSASCSRSAASATPRSRPRSTCSPPSSSTCRAPPRCRSCRSSSWSRCSAPPRRAGRGTASVAAGRVTRGAVGPRRCDVPAVGGHRGRGRRGAGRRWRPSSSRSLRVDGAWSLAQLPRPRRLRRGVLAVPVTTALQNSLRVAVDATLLAVVLGARGRRARHPPGPGAGRRAGPGRAFDGVFMLPLGVSAVTVGFGLLVALDSPPLDFRGSPWLVPIAQAMVALPLVVRLVVPALRSVSTSGSARPRPSLGAGSCACCATVDLPAAWRSGARRGRVRVRGVARASSARPASSAAPRPSRCPSWSTSSSPARRRAASVPRSPPRSCSARSPPRSWSPWSGSASARRGSGSEVASARRRAPDGSASATSSRSTTSSLRCAEGEVLAVLGPSGLRQVDAAARGRRPRARRRRHRRLRRARTSPTVPTLRRGLRADVPGRPAVPAPVGRRQHRLPAAAPPGPPRGAATPGSPSCSSSSGCPGPHDREPATLSGGERATGRAGPRARRAPPAAAARRAALGARPRPARAARRRAARHPPRRAAPRPCSSPTTTTRPSRSPTGWR